VCHACTFRFTHTFLPSISMAWQCAINYKCPPSSTMRMSMLPLAFCLSVSPVSAFTRHRAFGLFYRQRFHQLHAKPKRGHIVESYQTVSVNCSKCGERLFRYKKKNGTKSNLVKCFVERISEDSAGVLRDQHDADSFFCPGCQVPFARSAMMRGMPALKLIGGKVRWAIM
jgi:hypothetical protein